MEEDPAKILKNERKSHKEKKKLKVTVNFVQNDPEKLAPIVGYFPSGYDPHEKEQSEQMEKKADDVRVFRNKNKQGRYKVVVSPENCNVDFVGTNYLGEAACPQVCTYALGVLDKDNGTLNIVPIAANKIFRLDPKLKAPSAPKEDQDNIPGIEQSAETKASQIDNVTRLYGTKKSIQMANRRRAIYGDNRGGDEGDYKMEDGVVDKTAIDNITFTNTQRRNTPPLDITATTPDLLYPLNSIILKGEWPFLSSFFHRQNDLSSQFYPSFVHNRIHKLKDITDEEEKTKVSGILAYITYLIVFKDEFGEERKGSRSIGLPPILQTRFNMMFGEIINSKKLSKEKLDLLISYVLVLTLFVDSFETDISDIAKDLRMAAMNLRLHYRNLGCKFVRVSTTFRATLCPPLNFSGLLTRGKGRKRR